MKKKNPILDFTHEDYWVNQKVTLPPLEGSAEDWDMEDKEFDRIKAQEGRMVLITSIEVSTGGSALEAYYNFLTTDGDEFNMNFRILPLEMALLFGTAGSGYFGEPLPLDEHPHYWYIHNPQHRPK